MNRWSIDSILQIQLDYTKIGTVVLCQIVTKSIDVHKLIQNNKNSEEIGLTV